MWLCPKVVVDSKVHQNNYNAVYTLNTVTVSRQGQRLEPQARLVPLRVLRMMRANSLSFNKAHKSLYKIKVIY